jgi:hypothetical protein
VILKDFITEWRAHAPWGSVRQQRPTSRTGLSLRRALGPPLPVTVGGGGLLAQAASRTTRYGAVVYQVPSAPPVQALLAFSAFSAL